MAADDLIYTREKDGSVSPMWMGVPKVFMSDNILIGSAGMMFCPPIKYELQNWMADFLAMHHGTPNKMPSAIAESLHVKMRNTFKAIEASIKDDVWKHQRTEGRLVSFLVAGYPQSFKQPYVFEIGTDFNRNGDGLNYPLIPHHCRELPKDIYFGEDEFWIRASDGLEPQASFLAEITSVNLSQTANQLPHIPRTLQEGVASLVSLIKVEAKFNPKKVGQAVNIGLIDRISKKVYSASF